ncbi:MAG: glycosyltransferase family 2 protein [Clostridia bacterium]|nr:glycosyltransferase family 2 protein [Clostridia bacterium]
MAVKYSVVVPCFNEEETVGAFYSAVVPVMEKTKEKYELIFVNDGSRDKTEEILKDIASKDKKVKVINFSRNFGQQAALLAGFEASQGDAVIDIDVDLQDPVEAILPMIEKWKEGYDIVHGKRLVRKGETFFKKATSTIYTKFYKNITGLDIPKNCGDFKLFDRKVIDVITSMPERDRFLRGITAWVGFKQTYVEFERQKRVAGETKYTIKKLFKLATNGIVANSSYPLSLSLKTGIFGTICSLLAFVTFVVLSICKVSLPLTAWLFPTITFVGSLMFIFNGISNIYTARIYFEVQDRPKYIIREKINFDK